MVLLSALIHAIVLVYLVTSVRRGQSEPSVLQTYTVALVSPEALGLPTPAQPGVSDQAVKSEAAVRRPKPPPAKKEVPSQKLKATQKVQAKTATKPKKEVRPNSTPAKKQRGRQKDTQISAQERDQQILAALEKVRRHVKGVGDQARPAKTDYFKRGASSGASPQGDGRSAGTVRGLQFILYTEQVKRRVKQSWIVAELKTGLTVVVRFGIQANGDVFDVELAQRSGDIVFDESAVRAVIKASPLPPPPMAYRYEFARQKVEVVFGETRPGPSRGQ